MDFYFITLGELFEVTWPPENILISSAEMKIKTLHVPTPTTRRICHIRHFLRRSNKVVSGSFRQRILLIAQVALESKQQILIKYLSQINVSFLFNFMHDYSTLTPSVLNATPPRIAGSHQLF